MHENPTKRTTVAAITAINDPTSSNLIANNHVISSATSYSHQQGRESSKRKKKKKKKWRGPTLSLFVFLACGLAIVWSFQRQQPQLEPPTSSGKEPQKSPSSSAVTVTVAVVEEFNASTRTTTVGKMIEKVPAVLDGNEPKVETAASASAPRPTTKKEISDKTHCSNFHSAPSRLEWEDVYALEWNGTPAIIVDDDSREPELLEGRTNFGSDAFPFTRFTAHVQHLIQLMDIEQMEENCFWKFTLTVPKINSTEDGQTATIHRPSDLYCQGKVQQRIVPWWCIVLERLFFYKGNSTPTTTSTSGGTPQSANIQVLHSKIGTTGGKATVRPLVPTLPGSVSFAVSSDDFYQPPRPRRNQKQKKKALLAPYTCLANSAPNNGTFAITNFLELQRMADHTTYPILPWKQRCATPIWRGSAWMNNNGGAIGSSETEEGNKVHVLSRDKENITINTAATIPPILGQALHDCPRCRAVEFSNRFPHLLDAKFGDAKNGFFHPEHVLYQKWWKDNSTNGLHRLLPIDYIPPMEYFTQYQVAVVLCGLGAAFRTPIHFSTATAVLLQDCPTQEWYHFLKDEFQPWKHYIPVQFDLSDLPERLQWVQEHPDKVYMIARKGRQFYEDYLSFQRNYEHFYELIFRLAGRPKK